MALIGAIVALAGVAAAAIAGTAIVRITLRPLRRVAATASRVAEMPLERGEVALSVRVPEVDTDPRTEVGQVGAALNRMLGHIGNALAVRHASEMRMRQFLADVSHELRTPLAAISGYAELTRRTHEPVPRDVTYAMSRVESESARMTALVSDLLLLARLDSGRPLEHEDVDVSRLIVHVVSDAHVAAPEHRFALDLPEEPVTVTGDAARLHQVIANLLANARTHTPPGTQVTASLSVSAAEVVIAIVDDGPGIPPHLLPEVFERFARGDSSRSRAAGSTGLGLAIVAAVVEAHRGRVEATSRPGHTAFTVRLPRHAAATTALGALGVPSAAQQALGAPPAGPPALEPGSVPVADPGQGSGVAPVWHPTTGGPGPYGPSA
jgi:two-component system OmpR family sensor kinase